MDQVDQSHQYYLDIAQSMIKHGTCSHRNYGAVIVRDGKIVSTGYSRLVGQSVTSRGDPSSIDRRWCPIDHPKNFSGILHAEAVAIHAAKRELLPAATVYLVGWNMLAGALLTNTAPCMQCLYLIVKAGIACVVSRVSPTNYQICKIG